MIKNLVFWLFTAFTIIAAFLYLLSCLTPYISPVYFWPMSFFALGFPYLAAGILLLFFIWIFVRRKIAWILLLVFLTGFRNLHSTVAFQLLPTGRAVKKENTLRILTWNVRSFDNPSIAADSANGIRRRMFTYLQQVNADVLCFQEFTEHTGQDFLSNTKELIGLGYKYFYKTNEMPRYYFWGSFTSGTSIFSKVPIINSGKVMLGDTTYPEHLAWIDLLLQNRTVRIFSTHLKSINLFAQLTDPNNKVVFHGDSNLVYTDTKLEKLKIFGVEHAKEAAIVKEQLDKSPYPLMYCADMNSVPASYAYFTVAKNLQDAFLMQGRGLGTTLDSLPSTLRIDFLLTSKLLSVEYYHKDELHLSDHFPQYIDIAWRK